MCEQSLRSAKVFTAVKLIFRLLKHLFIDPDQLHGEQQQLWPQL